MRLTQWTDYTLRVLMYCAATEGRAQPVTITEVAEGYGISRSHLMKIVVFGAPLIAARRSGGVPPPWVFALAIPVSMAGTAAGGLVLNRLSDVNFKRYLRLILTVIGVAYLIQAARLFILGS